MENTRVEFHKLRKQLCQIERNQTPKAKNRTADSLTQFDGVGE